MRASRSILAAMLVLVVSLSPLLCVCRVSGAMTATAVRPCCRAHPPSDKPCSSCPHCTGKDVSTLPAQTGDVHQLAIAPPALFDLPLVWLVPVSPIAAPGCPAVTASPPPTLLSLHCALTC